MLRFTTSQELAVNQARAAFDASQIAMASQAVLVGNAAPVGLDAWRRILSQLDPEAERRAAEREKTERRTPSEETRNA